jgi:lysophospholipase L1-like esterase
LPEQAASTYDEFMRRASSGTEFVFFYILVVSLLSCSSAPKEIAKYVALGDSLTAGYQNDCLVADFQRTSFPNLIAMQLGIDSFSQPLISQPGIPSALEIASLRPLDFTRKEGFGQQLNRELPSPYDNLGIPGATLYSALNPDDLVATGWNPFYEDILRGKGNALEQALALQPELVTVWFGHNEILSGVTSGKIIFGETVFPLETFAKLLDDVLSKLSSSGAKIAIGNIMDLTEIPYVAYLPIYITDPRTGDMLRDESGKGVPYEGEEGTLSPGCHITLGGLGYIIQGDGIPKAMGGTGRPLPEDVILSQSDISKLKSLVAVYNETIAKVAAKYGAALIDFHHLFAEIKSKGYAVGGKTFSLDFPLGGLVSSDGIHPTSLGYAIIANEYIRGINRAFGYRIPYFPSEKLIKK